MKQAQLRSDGGEGISALQVRAYLADYPDFFVEQEELLEILSYSETTRIEYDPARSFRSSPRKSSDCSGSAATMRNVFHPAWGICF